MRTGSPATRQRQASTFAQDRRRWLSAPCAAPTRGRYRDAPARWLRGSSRSYSAGRIRPGPPDRRSRGALRWPSRERARSTAAPPGRPGIDRGRERATAVAWADSRTCLLSGPVHLARRSQPTGHEQFALDALPRCASTTARRCRRCQRPSALCLHSQRAGRARPSVATEAPPTTPHRELPRVARAPGGARPVRLRQLVPFARGSNR